MGACTSTTKKEKFHVNRQVMQSKVSINAYIWSKNTHNLFDFESLSYTRKEIEIDFSARLATLENELLAMTKNEWARNQNEFADIKFEEDGTTKLNPISSKQDHRIWAVIKNHNPTSELNSLTHWDLRQNDIVKLGRIRLQLIDYAFMKVEPQQASMSEYWKQAQAEAENEPDSVSQDYQGQEPIQCRVCFSRKATPENPLISPCSCTGSVKYIHVQCLQKWIGVQLKIKKGESFTQYTWKKMQCEICTFTFKNSYIYQGKSYSIMNIPKPNSSYMTLRITSDDKCKEGMIYVIEFQDKTELKIGRVPECDIKLKDISVSRHHAILKLIPSESHTIENPSYLLRIQDNNSKFGTLIYAQSEELLQIKEIPNPVLYQIGKLLINFSLIKKLKKSNVSCYKHPKGIPLFNISQIPLNDQATNFNKSQGNGSFQTHNELNLSEIVINEIAQGSPQRSPQINQAVIPQNILSAAPQALARSIDFDLSVCDEHEQA